MKKDYQKPVVDKIEFCYRDQVVAASSIPSGRCITDWVGRKDYGEAGCSIEVLQAHSGAES